MNGRIGMLGLVLGILSSSASANAENLAASKALFDKANEAMERKDYGVACPAFAESYQLAARPGTLHAMAECEAKVGRIATAVTLYDDFLRIVASVKNDRERNTYLAQARDAQAKRNELAKEIPQLTLVLSPSTPSDTRVTWNDEVLTAASLGVPIPVNPGEHVITAQVGGDVREVRVTIARGEKKTEVINPAVSEPIPPPPCDDKLGGSTEGCKKESEPTPGVVQPPPKVVEVRGNGLRTAGLVVGGVGVAGLIAGGVLGGLTWQKKGVINDHCRGMNCDPAGIEAANQARTLGLGSTLSFAVGAAQLATGVVMLVVNRGSKTVELGNTPQINVGLLDAGPMGAVVGVKGTF